ncbi:HelD family protein [Arsenicicoccus dermatophilus]|uniref:HelD family protein n=1 Tax=Arsenicicoccus dermatophilus TaxID=1076331 RepID=UPI001F4C8615|nr:ATP-binding domain-containing protein [Arsenicicoccus dermatophilus]MCH8612053.1 ATP-binding domain-containing protein [Arsenicicoccus dermatophilus]
MPAAPDPCDLGAEQDYLLRARAALAAMRNRTMSLQVNAGDPIAAERLAVALWQRARSLEDDPTTALFFGRLDLDTADDTAQEGHERLYVGRRHVSDESGDPLVIDWRAPVSTAYYRASPDDPMGVRLRRRFGYDRGEISAIEDEDLTGGERQQQDSQILAHEIERPRVGPMRDIVSTIQPEQDALVRVDDATTICIQGAPGTGKTAVGLHRAAWLLYAYRERLSRQGVLVVGPNAAFLEHIAAVLPTLGEVQVRHTTVDGLVTEQVRVRATDSPELATLKGDARLAEVLDRAVRAQVREPHEALVVPRGARRWRVPAHEVRDLVEELQARDVRYDAARQMLPQRLAHAVLVLMEAAGDSPDDRVQDAVASSTPVKRYAESVWPQLDARAVLHRLWSDPDALAAAADGVLTEEEQRMLLWDKAPRTPGTARWTVADAVLIDEVGDLLTRTPSVGHVVLDEAQDLSPMQLRAVGRRCSTGAATVLGDIAQGTTPWATGSWAESLTHLGKPDGQVTELVRGFRVPASVIAYAARLLPAMAPGLAAPESVRSDPGRLAVVATSPRTLVERVAEETRDVLAEPGSLGVIVADDQVAAVADALAAAGIEHGVLGADHGDVEHRVDVVPATMAKGLEFDAVVVVEPTRIAAAEPDRRTGLRRLYVVLTRAVSRLVVVHAEPLPPLLATDAGE